MMNWVNLMFFLGIRKYYDERGREKEDIVKVVFFKEVSLREKLCIIKIVKIV